MIFQRSEQFKKDYKKLSVTEQKLFLKKVQTISRFGLEYPSLRIKKIKGFIGTWELSVNMRIRASFEKKETQVIFFRKIGEHDQVLKNP